MPCKTAFLVSEDFLKYDFGPWHPFKPYRWKLALEILERKKVFEKGFADIVTARRASIEELLMVHDRSYIEFVAKATERGEGFLDYGDTPARKGVFEGALARVGASIQGVDLVLSGFYNHAFNPCGGLHHARTSAAAGFCVFNDLAVAVRHAQRRYGLKRIAVIDVDGHHGDGTQDIFYKESSVLKISLHRYGIYPGSGWYTEIGYGEGEGYTINIPLPENTDDSSYLYAFREIVVPVVLEYKPELIILQYGADSHYEDPLVGLGLTTYGYEEIMRIIHRISHETSGGRILVTGGGGYVPENVARIWSIGFIRLADLDLDISDLHDRIEKSIDREPSYYVRDLVERIKNLLRRYYRSL
ncbi:MAG: acetoin utilization protein AcuC [Sulfolobales archaeon]